ncbi:MAG: cation diffusion facilitator family transporter [Anaerolineae bacterium]|nr:cation diffusion facilitator family transporter [Anaerolineae bacterium]
MSHQHNHNPDNIRLAFFLNLGFTILEIIGGLLINSVAILSDSVHDLGDSFSLGLAWFLENYANRGSDQRYSYGYRRFSLLGALINALVLIVGSLLVLSQTIPRLIDPEPFNAPGMIVFAVIGVAVNGFAALRLRRNQSANAQVVGWHLLEDVLGWAAVLVVGIVAVFVDLPILDPILSILITVYVLVNVLRRLYDSARLFLQAVPQEVDLGELRQRLLGIEGVESIHHLHLWSLDGEHNVFTTHLVVPDETSYADMLRIRKTIRAITQDLNLEHVTVEVERTSEDCAMRHEESEIEV